MTTNLNVKIQQKSKVKKPQKRGVLSARKLLTTAAQLFVEKGFDATSVDDIVKSANSSKGTFYHHYESKAALLLALRERVIEQHQEVIEEKCLKSKNENLYNKLETWIVVAIDAYEAIGDLHDVVFSNHPESRWTVSNMKFMKRLVAILQQGNEENAWSVSNPVVAATFIYRGITGTIDDAILTNKPLNEIKSDMIKLALNTVQIKY